VETRPEEPAPRIPDVVPATRADLAGVADALADAFWDDPVMSWILREEGSRSRRLARLFGVQLRGHYLPLGTVWTTTDHAGGALWAPPGHAILPAGAILRHLPEMLRALGRHAVRAVRTLDHVERQHPKEPHWYLGVPRTPRYQCGSFGCWRSTWSRAGGSARAFSSLSSTGVTPRGSPPTSSRRNTPTSPSTGVTVSR
jgi:hypothetical protein